MASGDIVCALVPQDNEPPASNYATLDTRNGHPVLAFDTTTAEGAVFTAFFRVAAASCSIHITWVSAAATSGTVGWTAEVERMQDAGTDIDSDSFDSVNTVTAATVPATSGIPKVTSAALTNGDSTAAGEWARVRIKRDVANDTLAEDAQILAVAIKET